MQQQQLKQLMKSGLLLYYQILKLHIKKLPPGKIRSIGDLYVKYQFRQHHQNPSLQHYQQFYKKWQQYKSHLEGQGLKGVTRNLSEEENKLLNNDQKTMLQNLKDGVTKNNK